MSTSGHSTLFILLAPLVAANAQNSTDPVPAAFSIRVDPSIAGEVNSVLASYAQNVLTDVPKGEDVASYLQRRCGGKVPPKIVKVSDLPSGKHRVEHSACARFGGGRTVVVEAGLTLEGIAARWGLRADKVGLFKIRSGPANPGRSGITAATMLPGDEVFVPQTSLWSEIQLKAELPIGRSGLRSAIADALGCVGDQGACLRGKGVLLLNQGQEVERPEATSASRSPIDGSGSSMDERAIPIERLQPLRNFAMIATTSQLMNSQYAAAAASLETTATAGNLASNLDDAMASSVDVDDAPVAPDQWPYDKARIAAILKQDRDLVRFVKIGVADGGLGSSTGFPLPPSLLAPNAGELDEGATDDDDDDNQYVDDFYGAGLRRSDDTTLATDMLGTGKLDLCPVETDFASWPASSLLRASHGAVVSSIAIGWPLLGPNPDAWPKLPRIQFYRMVTRQCGPESRFEVQGSEINKAIRYLFGQKVDVVNLSYKTAIRGENRDLRDAARAELNNDDRMLVVSAGNDDPDDLDDGRLCPACLGSPIAGEYLPKRVLVVGSAERTLRPSLGSNQGEKTVRFYAPGQANGIDILGRPVSDPQSATSYSAPLAALAVAALKSYNINGYWEITERLDAATWPLLMADGSHNPTARVIDLTKVFAVYRDVVEAVVVENGQRIRRDYVGTIVGQISEISICQSTTFKRAQVHAIRLGPVRPDGNRTARWEERQVSDSFPQRSIATCRSSGQITIDDLLGERVTLQLHQVSQILLRWTTRPN